jgi:dCTP diphosphatase
LRERLRGLYKTENILKLFLSAIDNLQKRPIEYAKKGNRKKYMDINELTEKIRIFNKERNWEQFHLPQNLTMALMVEVAEIAEHFQWAIKDTEQYPKGQKLDELKDEIGDVLICLINLADKLGIDPVPAAIEKLEKNRIKYPVEKVKGKSFKYSEYK